MTEIAEPTISSGCRDTPAVVRDKLALESSAVRNLEPAVCQCRRCAVVATVRKLLRRVTLKNRVNTNVSPASRAIGGCYGIRGFGSAFFGGSVPCK
jgi:hypothetical protein